ncbi:hypothetical protein Fcan01_17628 [Folsomia candida]|uniref:Uncharacterized protein n=1 Tax=Folsomia candida TaxID=158441 RepID=A0A226DS04_FOLCA|nr:hypothetical protein Fcan01_17628 [Folsomia candida]
MALFWVLEALPIPITSLLPVALFPLLGLQSTSQVVGNYMKESGMMFLGGISLALGISHCGLHKRLALKTLLVIGTSPWRLLFGVLLTTSFLSCWVVSTTAAAMAVPIVSGLVEAFNVSDKERKKLRILFFLAAGYGANVGGTAVIIGSSANLIFRDLVALENIGQNGKYRDINFATWAAFGVPIALVNILIVWGVLGFIHLRGKKSLPDDVDDDISQDTDAHTVRKNLSQKLKDLGPLSFHEKAISVIFGLTVLLWFTRDPQVFPGWQEVLFPSGQIKIGDSSVAIIMVFVMFTIPKDPKVILKWKKLGSSTETLMTWSHLQSNFPWSVLLLLGGGFAISDGAQVSGLSEWVGQQLEGLSSLPHPVLLFIILLIVSVLTEFTSNSGTVSLLTPILFSLSRRLDIHPLYVSFAAVIVSQYAFVLPTSNPSNAICFAAGELRIKDMATPGLFEYYNRRWRK